MRNTAEVSRFDRYREAVRAAIGGRVQSGLFGFCEFAMRAVVVVLMTSLLSAVVAAEGSKGPSEIPADVVATVGDRALTVDEFQAEVERRSADGAHYPTLEQRQSLLREMIRKEAVVASALEAGYDDDPEYIAAVQRILINRYTEDILGSRLQRVTVSEAEIRQRFEDNRAVYSRPERVKGAVIFLAVGPRANDDQIAAIEQRANELREAAIELTEVNHLGQLAVNNSEDRATRYTGGVLPWMIPDREYKWGPEVVDAIASIPEIGGVGPVVRTRDGFYVVRLVDREGPQELPFEMYASGIRRQILREKQSIERENFYRELEEKYGVAVNLRALESIPGLSTPAPREQETARPPALPGQ